MENALTTSYPRIALLGAPCIYRFIAASNSRRLAWESHRILLYSGMVFAKPTRHPRTRAALPHKEGNMHTHCIERLRELAEPLTALSLTHLTPATRQKLREDDLSVNAYPTDFGGFVFVGSPRYRLPLESDLATIFEAAEQAGIVWLKFDSEAPTIAGLPAFAPQDPIL